MVRDPVLGLLRATAYHKVVEEFLVEEPPKVDYSSMELEDLVRCSRDMKREKDFPTWRDLVDFYEVNLDNVPILTETDFRYGRTRKFVANFSSYKKSFYLKRCWEGGDLGVKSLREGCGLELNNLVGGYDVKYLIRT